VHESVFYKCIAGIYISGFNQPEILLNEFYSSNGSVTIQGLEDPFYGDIYLDECTGYHVEGNKFSCQYMYGGAPLITDIGIYIKDSGSDDNEIYNNEFEDMEAGIVIEGINKGETTGLCVKCNDFETCMNDIIVVPNAWEGTYIGIRATQGSSRNDVTAPAGNTFTTHSAAGVDNGSSSKSWWNYLNYCDDFIYYHHLKDEDPLTYPTEDNYTDSTITLYEQYTLVYSKSTACPSGISSGSSLKSFTDFVTTMNNAQSEIELLQDQYDNYVDGGNTDEMIVDILTSMPDNAMAIRQQLLNESPYLSDTTLKQAIAKENVLPNVMVRDILVANPQSAKRNYVLEEINNRFDPMPDYLMAEIMAGEEVVGAKENLESQIEFWRNIKQRAFNGLICQWMNDTNLINPIDSVLSLYNSENTLESQYRLAFCYLDINNITEAVNKITSIPQNYSLSNMETAIQGAYIDYFTIIQNRFSTNGCMTPLDSSQIASLFQIMEAEYPIISVYARGTLIKEGVIDFNEKVNFPDNTALQNFFINNDEERNSRKNYFDIYPNPASYYTIVYLNTDELNTTSVLKIFDMNGRMLNSYILNSIETEVILDLDYLPNGVYNLILINQGRVLDFQRMIKF
jgi:hypothetical protein